MAVTFVEVKVSNPARPKKAVLRKFLVDSGAVYSVVPEEDLKALGIKPNQTREFMLANGETVQKKIGNAFFEFEGTVAAAPVVFGDPKIYLLGATTLEGMGLILDPFRRELKPAPMLLMTLPKQRR